jgi:alpha-glucosidase
MSSTQFIHHDSSSLHVSNTSPKLGEIITVYLRIPAELQPDVVGVRATHDGEPTFSLAKKVQAPHGDDTDTWWAAELLVRNPRQNYRWLVSGGNVGYGWLTQLGWINHDVNDAADFAITVYGEIPHWSREAVVYQIFPDRFARSGRTYDVPQWAVPREWNMPPEGRGPNTSFEYFGGDLWGVRDHLEYIKSVGATCIYLTPIFPAGSVHRYDAQSFDTVDPLLGGDEALIALVESAHAMGIRVIGDITLNHSGNTHAWFEAALAGDPEYRDFYTFDESIDCGYEAWLGVPSLPKFNYASAALREKLISGEDSVIRKWLKAPFNLDGWRVDVANMSGRQADFDCNHEVARITREAVQAEGADKLLIGEHNHDAGVDLDGDGWFGNMNYTAFRNPALMWLASDDIVNTTEMDYQKVPQGLIPSVDAQGMLAVMRQYSSRMPWSSYSSSWNLLSSHDSPRIRSIVGSRSRQVAAAVLMATFPGTPMIFAGDELGAQGMWGEDSRTTHPWDSSDNWDTDLLATYTALNTLRSQSPALADGSMRVIYAAKDVLAYVRETSTERLLVIVAREGLGLVNFRLLSWSANSMEHLFGFEGGILEEGQVTITIDTAGGGIWRLT